LCRTNTNASHHWPFQGSLKLKSRTESKGFKLPKEFKGTPIAVRETLMTRRSMSKSKNLKSKE